MDDVGFVPFLLGAIGLAVCVLHTIAAFDSLVRFQHREFPDEWERDGRPTTFFGSLPGTTLFGNWEARHATLRKWFTRSPDWASENRHVARSMRMMRYSAVTAAVLFCLLACSLIALAIGRAVTG